MNQEQYNEFLNKIEVLTSYIAEASQRDNISPNLINTIRDKIDELNSKAEQEYSIFIAADRASYDNKINELKNAISQLDPALASDILPSEALIPATDVEQAPDKQPSTQTDSYIPTDVEQTPEKQSAPQTDISAENQSPTTKELELFKKLHRSSFDPKSPMDKRKLEQLRQAAQQTGEEDFGKLSSATYALQAKDKTTAYTPQRSSQKQSAINKATAPASLPGGPTYYVRTGFNQYRPAINADISSNQQLFMKNPNPVGRAVYPYVKVDSRSVRRASPAR